MDSVLSTEFNENSLFLLQGCDVMNKRKLIHPFPLEFFREEQPAAGRLCFAPLVALWQKMVPRLREYDGGVGGERAPATSCE